MVPLRKKNVWYSKAQVLEWNDRGITDATCAVCSDFSLNCNRILGAKPKLQLQAPQALKTKHKPLKPESQLICATLLNR